MKKAHLFILLSVLVCCLFSTALAETRSYILTYLTDPEGNILSDSGIPASYFVMDDETFEFGYSTSLGTQDGLYELTEINEEQGYLVLTCSLWGKPVCFVYYTETDSVTLLDEDNNLLYVFLPQTQDLF